MPAGILEVTEDRCRIRTWIRAKLTAYANNMSLEPGSAIRKKPVPDPGSKSEKALDPRSATL